MHGEPVCLRKVDRDEIDARLHQGRDKVNVASKPIQFGDDKRRAVQATQTQRFGELRPVGTLAALDFDELADKDMATCAVEIVAHGLPLRFEPERRMSLAGGADAVVGDELRSSYTLSFVSTTVVTNVRIWRRVFKLRRV